MGRSAAPRAPTVARCRTTRLVPVQIAYIGGVRQASGQIRGMVRERAHGGLTVGIPFTGFFPVVGGIPALGQFIPAWGDDGDSKQLVARAGSAIAAEGGWQRLVLDWLSGRTGEASAASTIRRASRYTASHSRPATGLPS